MEIEVTQVTEWKDVLNAARFTSRMNEIDKEPSEEFKEKMLKAEHSPLRLLEFDVKMYDIPYWVSVHLVRHHIGVEKFVSTQRDDRTDNDTPRSKQPQDAPVNMWIRINAQALINISRVRLCSKASKETREIWREVVKGVIGICPEFRKYLMPNCLYRGGCPEINPCGRMPTI